MKLDDLDKVARLQRQRRRLLENLSAYATAFNVDGKLVCDDSPLACSRPTVTFYHLDGRQRIKGELELGNDAETQAIFALLKSRTERLARENAEALAALGVEVS